MTTTTDWKLVIKFFVEDCRLPLNACMKACKEYFKTLVARVGWISGSHAKRRSWDPLNISKKQIFLKTGCINMYCRFIWLSWLREHVHQLLWASLGPTCVIGLCSVMPMSSEGGYSPQFPVLVGWLGWFSCLNCWNLVKSTFHGVNHIDLCRQKLVLTIMSCSRVSFSRKDLKGEFGSRERAEGMESWIKNVIMSTI